MVLRPLLELGAGPFEVYSFSYRGFTPNDGADAGPPSERNIVDDALGLLEYVTTNNTVVAVPPPPVVMAHSIGTGPCGESLVRERLPFPPIFVSSQ